MSAHSSLVVFRFRVDLRGSGHGDSTEGSTCELEADSDRSALGVGRLLGGDGISVVSSLVLLGYHRLEDSALVVHRTVSVVCDSV